MGVALDRDEATAIVSAGLCLSRVQPPAETIARIGPWILGAMGERLDLPPVGVVGDLGALLFGASLRSGVRAPIEDDAIATALRRYEDSVLGRIAADGRLASAGFAVARLPAEMHARAVGILVAGILKRLDFDAGVEVQPGVVRALTEKKREEALERGYSVLRDDPEIRNRLVFAYGSLARCAQKSRDLIGDADLFALENLVVLGSLTQRLAIADVVDAQEAIAEAIPRRIPRRRRKEGDIASKLEDESEYPVGGFSSVSTSGSLENIVTSELIYMDPPRPKGEPADVDLFDMRYVEGELLYYTRDEAIIVRRRRLVVLVLSPDLVRARIKDRELPWQRIVLILGVVLVLTKKLVDLLGDEALEIRVVFLRERERDRDRDRDTSVPAPLADERALAELMLREWREKGMADVLEATWQEVIAFTTESARRALVEVVRIGVAPPPSPAPLDPRIAQVDFVPPPASLHAWSQATTALLSALL